jgi:tRNA 5-methylaminomethyl-2-thiouridine biosynthesis bifunctional protein
VTRRLPPEPDLAHDEAGRLKSKAFGDIYASGADPVGEGRLVFLDGCDLPARFGGRPHFTIAELGFGTGLNLLIALEAWRAARDPGAILHFLSVEGFPLSRDAAATDLRAATRLYPSLAASAEWLLDSWPDRMRGTQILWTSDRAARITLMMDPVEEALAGADFKADAWFLDGFAPARNPEMWSDAVLSQVRRLTAPGGFASTWSAAGFVRAALAERGFIVERKLGFAGKRHRTVARLDEAPVETGPRPSSALIIGGGIAGACLAEAFAKRGIGVDVIDALSPASGASGNPLALMSPRLDRDDGPIARTHRAAWAYAARFWAERPEHFTPCGLIEAAPDADAGALLDLIANPPIEGLEAIDPAAFDLPNSAAAMRVHKAGVIRAFEAVRTMIGLSARSVSNASVDRLEHRDGAWCALDADGEVISRAEIAVIANGACAAALPQTSFLPIAPRRGQLNWSEGDQDGAPFAVSQSNYAARVDGRIVFGATFEAADDPGPVTDAATASNLSALGDLWPDAARRIEGQMIDGRTGVRATLPDRLPAAGPVPDEARWRATNAGLKDGRLAVPDLSPDLYLKGLFVLAGLGTRGFTLAPLMAEHIVAAACGEPAPVEVKVAAAIAPERFIARQMKRVGKPG